ncbi:hypothetical protein GALMADRAFT_143281 [Galerina marginata CBS 339.88]|uniref:Uncharacterized protein n=1 Tax=Galerina marginata (strain CBS 339.88) TaxID=685588 RepID=A0A067SNK1_GALM3|nr:hypothetical protein GALMADRAFT_143281 [Galerina marginata CBS 339.88]
MEREHKLVEERATRSLFAPICQFQPPLYSRHFCTSNTRFPHSTKVSSPSSQATASVLLSLGSATGRRTPVAFLHLCHLRTVPTHFLRTSDLLRISAMRTTTIPTKLGLHVDSSSGSVHQAGSAPPVRDLSSPLPASLPACLSHRQVLQEQPKLLTVIASPLRLELTPTRKLQQSHTDLIPTPSLQPPLLMHPHSCVSNWRDGALVLWGAGIGATAAGTVSGHAGLRSEGDEEGEGEGKGTVFVLKVEYTKNKNMKSEKERCILVSPLDLSLSPQPSTLPTSLDFAASTYASTPPTPLGEAAAAAEGLGTSC